VLQLAVMAALALAPTLSPIHFLLVSYDCQRMKSQSTQTH
jgi:hypothetical protein